jgi:hypothetical protein
MSAATTCRTRRRWRALLALCLLAVVSGSAAQTLSLHGTACVSDGSVCQGLGFGVAWRGVRVGDATVDLELGTDGLGFALTASQTFGPLGNLIVEAGGDLRPGPIGRARLGARGVIASVAARLALGVAGADHERFDPLAVAGDGPLLGGRRYSLEAGGTFRLSRQAILDVSPALHLTADGVAATGGAVLRLVRALGENELHARLGFALLPAAGDHAALGATLVLPRGRAPDWEFAAWLGYGERGFLPGGAFSLAESLGGGGRVEAAGSFEPYRRDVRPLRATAAVELPVAGARARLELAGGALHPVAADALAFRLGVTWPFPP